MLPARFATQPYVFWIVYPDSPPVNYEVYHLGFQRVADATDTARRAFHMRRFPISSGWLTGGG